MDTNSLVALIRPSRNWVIRLGELQASFKPAVVETKIEAEEVEEAVPKKRRKEKAMAAEKPTVKRARKEKHKTESKRPKKPKKGASKEESK